MIIQKALTQLQDCRTEARRCLTGGVAGDTATRVLMPRRKIFFFFSFLDSRQLTSIQIRCASIRAKPGQIESYLPNIDVFRPKKKMVDIDTRQPPIAITRYRWPYSLSPSSASSLLLRFLLPFYLPPSVLFLFLISFFFFSLILK